MIRFREDDFFLVTGASSGIGAAVALKLNELGASVIASGRDEARLAETAGRAARPESLFQELKDLTADLDGLPAWLQDLKNKYGRLRGLAHCAGVTAIEPVDLLNPEGLKKIFACNLFAPLMLAKGFIDRRVNVGRGSALVMFASVAASHPARGQAAYGASKAALITAVKALAKETAPRGLRANCVSPAMIDTPMTAEYLRLYGNDSSLAAYPLGLGEPADAAHLAVFLLSDAARWITGRDYVLDGGSY